MKKKIARNEIELIYGFILHFHDKRKPRNLRHTKIQDIIVLKYTRVQNKNIF